MPPLACKFSLVCSIVDQIVIQRHRRSGPRRARMMKVMVSGGAINASATARPPDSAPQASA